MKQLIDKALTRAYWIKQRASYSLFPDRIIQDVPAIGTADRAASGKRIGHVAMYTNGNAGDTLLPRTVRDAIDEEDPLQWSGIHAHRVVNKKRLNEINELNATVFPNPTQTELNIRLQNDELTSAKLFNLTGQLVQEEVFSGTTTLNLNDFPAGLYLLKLENKEGRSWLKVVKE